MSTVVNYNRSLQTNTAGTIVVPLPAFPAEVVLAEFGLFVPATASVNFVELIATVGWQSTPTPNTGQPLAKFFIYQDNVQVALANQEPPANNDGTATPVDNTTTFQAILTNVPVGHHVYQLRAQNFEPAEGTLNAFGPITISGSVIA